MALKTIANSLLMDIASTEYLTRTPGAADSTTTWTLSVWFKRTMGIVDSAVDTVFSAGTDASNYTSLAFDTAGRLRFRHVVAGADTDDLVTRAQFRDPTGWYHLVVRYDSTETTDTDRVRLWVNNIQLTDFSTANWPGASAATDLLSTQVHEIGREAGTATNLFDGYLSDFYLCDGQALSPTDFAEQNAATWQPIAGTPTYGAEGFILEFDTGADLGDDTSGNVNDWTEVVLDSSNQKQDTPTQNGLTFNPHYYGKDDDIDLNTGATRLAASNSVHVTAAFTAAIPTTGKWYWEYRWGAGSTAVDKITMGIIRQHADLNGRVGDDQNGWGLYNPSGTVIALRSGGSDANFTDTAAFAVTDFFSVAFDADTGKLWFGREGTWLDSGDPETGALPHDTLDATDRFGNALIPAASIVTASNTLEIPAFPNYLGTIPNGFKPLRADQFPTPSITDPKDYFDVASYAGDGSNPRSLTSFQFQPGFAYVKSTDRDPSNHIMTNSVVGGGVVWLNDLTGTDQPSNPDGDIAALISNGITLDQVTTANYVNASGNEYIAMAWKEDAAAGFDVVGYVGTAAAQAIAHGLGVVPDYMYVRNRTVSNANLIYAGVRLGITSAPVLDPATDYLVADTSSPITDSLGAWNDTEPDASEFTVGSFGSVNDDGEDHVAMLWAEVEGFSKFSAYIGTGAIDEESPFIYCGFRPKLVRIKRTTSSGSWLMILSDTSLAPDSAFDGGTNATRYFESNEDAAMTSPVGVTLDMCASGFKITQSFSSINASGGEYMVEAFAEVPYQLASAFSPNKTGAGALDLLLELDGDAQVEHQHGDGAIDLNFLMSGDGTGGRAHGNSAPELALEIDGTGSAPIIERSNADAALDLFLEIDGQGFNIAMRSDFELPQLTSNGTVVGSVPAFGTVTLPALTANGTMPQALVLTGRLVLPQLQTTGSIDPEQNLILPLLETTGSTILAGTTIRGPAINLPVLQIVGTGNSPIILTGSPILLPRLDVTSTIVGGSLITSGGVLTGPSIALPGLEANGFLLVPQEMAGVITLPALDVGPDAILAPGAILTSSVTLPLLRTTTSLLVNGVSLTATVWSMNTETLETTNYLNYDFVGLVNFADQPYGVTANGIFLLAGDDDDGTNIDARILSGISDRGDENLKEAAQMYMQYEGLGMMFQLLPDGQQRLREYRFERRSNSSGVIHARAKGSRGLRSRSWQMGLRNLSGGAFTLDKLGLLLRQLTRKTRKN